MRVVEHRPMLGTRGRRPAAGRQALLTLARLAAGFVVGTTTVYRYVAEAVALLVALAPASADARRRQPLPLGNPVGCRNYRRRSGNGLREKSEVIRLGHRGGQWFI